MIKNILHTFPRVMFAADGDDLGGGGAGDAGNGDTVDSFVFRDPKSGQELELPVEVGGANLKELIGHVISKTRNDTKKSVEGQFQPIMEKLGTLENRSSELEAELEKYREQGMSSDEILKKKQAKWEEQIDQHKQAAEANMQLFQRTKIENDLITSMAGYELHNPEQTMLLMKSLSEPYLDKDENGNYVTKVKIILPDESGQRTEHDLTPKEAFQKWIALEENKHHLRNNLRPGGGTSTTGRVSSDGVMQYTREELASNPEARIEYLKKIKAGEDVSVQDQ